MAAFTEGFSDSGAGVGKGRQHLGKVIGLVLEARQMASDERREAQKKLSEQAPHLTLEDFGIQKGYFFKKALQHNFGGAFIDRKKSSLKKLLSARRILNSKKKLYVTTRNFLRDNTRLGKVDGRRSSSFKKKFEYKLEVESPAGLEDSSKKVAKAASGGGGGPRTKQDFLTAVTEIAKSLQSTAQSINNAVDQNTGIASGIVSTQKNIVVEISHRTDRVTDKLEAIAAAVNQQTEFLKRAKATAKADKKEESGEFERLNNAFTRGADKLGTKKDESLEMSTSEESISNKSRTNTTRMEDPWDMEKGGVIIDGPDTGYRATTPTGVPFTAHGKEWMGPAPAGGTAVVPIDNRATDGIQGNEVTPGGDLMAEKGMTLPNFSKIPNFKALSPLSGLNLSKTFSSPTPTSRSRSGGAQNIINAMELPFRAVGASLIKVASQVRDRVGEVSPVADGKISNIMNVIANAFGLSSQDVAPSKATSEANARMRAAADKMKEDSERGLNWYHIESIKKQLQLIKNFLGDKLEQTGNLINSVSDKIKETVGWGKGLVDNMLGRNKKDFSQKEIAAMLFDEFKKQGMSEDGAKLAVAEFMRETGLDQGLILGSHDDGGVEAFGAGSWQNGREDALFAHLESLGIKRDDIANSGEVGIRGNASFLVEEIASRGNNELMELLKKPNLSKEEQERVRKLFKDAYFVYAESIPLTKSEEALKYIHKLLGVDISSIQSISSKDAFTANDVLEKFNLGNTQSATEIAYVNLGDNGALTPSTGFTDTLSSARDTIEEGLTDPLGIDTYYKHSLHHV